MRSRLPLAAVIVACVALWAASPASAGDAPCADCHDEVAAKMSHQVHMRIRPFEVQGHTVGCEGCHGDGAAHADSGDPAQIRTFSDPGPADEAACLDCHQGKGLPEWHASVHAAEGVACFECHRVHRAANPLDACRGCHADVVAAHQLPSHHPVREGKMSCASCHDPHAASEAMLRTATRVNDLCFTCHQDKEGPFVFEHEPVVEDCRLCHQPHGSVADNLLTAGEPMLCYQCHEPHFHAGLVSPPGAVDVGGSHRENPFGSQSMNVAFTTACSQCHSQVHGTDLPSQALASGGRGLVR